MSSQPNPAALDADDFKITTPLPGVAHGAATPGGPEPGPIPVRRLWFPFFTPLRNPGKFENLQRESGALEMMELFDGVNFTLGRQASEAFSLSHHLQLPIDSEHNYFLALDHRRDNLSLGAQWLSNGRVGGSVRFPLGPLRLAYHNSFDGPNRTHSGDVEYYGPDCTALAKFTNAMGGILTAAYSQAITRDLALGVQLEGFFKPAEFGVSWNARYETPDWVFSGLLRYTSHGIFSVTRKIGQGISATSQFLVQQDPNSGRWVSSGMFGVDYQFLAARFKGTIDSRGVVRSVFEESIADVMTITLCNELVFPLKQYRLGFGFSINL